MTTSRQAGNKSNQPKEFEMPENKKSHRRVPRPTPALVVAFVALFAAMGGFGYAAAKLKPNSVRTKSIQNAAVTTNKLADGAVTTPKLAPDAVAPNARYAVNAANAANATNAVNAANAARLGGAAPGKCQTGWLKGSLVVDTDVVTPAQPTAVVSGFDCASKAQDAVQIERTDVGRYLVTFAGNDPANAVVTSAGDNAVTAVTKTADGLLVKVWNNSDAMFVDGKSFSLIAF
jgi:hypothetical protein